MQSVFSVPAANCRPPTGGRSSLRDDDRHQDFKPIRSCAVSIPESIFQKMAEANTKGQREFIPPFCVEINFSANTRQVKCFIFSVRGKSCKIIKSISPDSLEVDKVAKSPVRIKNGKMIVSRKARHASPESCFVIAAISS